MNSAMDTHPVTLVVEDDLRRNRLTVFFRYLLAIPHFIWLELWGILALIVALLNWVVTLVMGRPPAAFHRFLSAFVRQQLHVSAFLTLAANPFPGFAGEEGYYPLDLVLPAEPQRQNRAKTFFRLFLVFPAFFILYPLAYAMYIAAFFTWWVALITGKAPRGLRDMAAYALRYQAQLSAYLFLITDRYPSASPFVGTQMGRTPPGGSESIPAA